MTIHGSELQKSNAYTMTLHIPSRAQTGPSVDVGGVMVPNVIDVSFREVPDAEEDVSAAFLDRPTRIATPKELRAEITLTIDAVLDTRPGPAWEMRRVDPAGPAADAQRILTAHDKAGTLGEFLAGVGAYLRR